MSSNTELPVREPDDTGFAWVDAEVARRETVEAMDGVDSIHEAAARRALPPAEVDE